MSNKVTIQQQTATVKNNGTSTKEIIIFDNYAFGKINLDDYSKDFYDDELKILEFVISVVKNNDSIIKSILNYIIAIKTGIKIEGTWYDYEEIESILNKLDI